MHLPSSKTPLGMIRSSANFQLTFSRLVYFTSGLIHITLPNSTDEVWVQGGKYGLILAADTPDVSAHGHRTQYPGDATSIALQVPLSAEAKLDYVLLHNGSCTLEDMVGL